MRRLSSSPLAVMDSEHERAPGEAGQHRDHLKGAVGHAAGPRRRLLALSGGKERREALVRSKRLRRTVAAEDGALADMTADGAAAPPPGESSRQAGEESVRAAVRKLEAAIAKAPGRFSGERLAALREVRELLSPAEAVDVPPLAAAVRGGLVPLLILCLQFGAPEEQLLEAAWCLTNLASGEREEATAVLPAAALLVAHMGASSPGQVAEQCAWAVGNLAGEGPEVRGVLMDQGALPALTRLLLAGAAPPGPSSAARTAAWALSNLVKGPKPGAAVELMKGEKVPAALVTLLGSGNEELAVEVAWVVFFVTALWGPAMDKLVTAGIVPPLVALLAASADPALLTPVSRIVGYLTTGPDAYTDSLFTAGQAHPGGLGGLLARLLDSPHRTLQKEAAWVVSNIAGGAGAHKDAVFSGPLMPLLVRVLQSGPFNVRKEAAYAVGNVCMLPATERGEPRGSAPAQQQHRVSADKLSAVVAAGCLPPFVSLVRSPDGEAARLGLQFVEMCLRCLPGGRRLVEQAEGLDALELLQFQENDELQMMANLLIDTYFKEDSYALDTEPSWQGQGLSPQVDGEYPPWRRGGSTALS